MRSELSAKDVVIQLIGVKKAYRVGEVITWGLRGVDLKVRRGEFIAIMGPSGSGKTTLLNMIGLLDKPTEGKILIDGVDVSRLKSKELAYIRNRKIGFVFQFFNLLPELTAIENVMFPMMLAGKPNRDRATELLKLVGLEKVMTHLPSELSGGEQQRVAIVRALANNSSILLADEPTGNLDTESGMKVLELLKKLNKELGQTIVTVTHEEHFAKMGDRVVKLRDGRIESF